MYPRIYTERGIGYVLKLFTIKKLLTNVIEYKNNNFSFKNIWFQTIIKEMHVCVYSYVGVWSVYEILHTHIHI